LLNIKVLSANKICEILIAPPLLGPAMNPVKSPPFANKEIILLNTSITITSRKGDKGLSASRLGATKKTCRSAIHQYRELHRGNIISYPFTPSISKTASSQQIQEKNPIDMVISLFNAQLAQLTWLCWSNSKALVGNENIV
jgi:hypothetical protein